MGRRIYRDREEQRGEVMRREVGVRNTEEKNYC
jgi:hypothetical protein